MSTIQSSAEHLTLNADGSSKDIKFQANGVEKASIDSSGNLTVSGNLTSVGIDDNADATAITIDSSENVGIGASPSGGKLVITGTGAPQLKLTEDGEPKFQITLSGTTTTLEAASGGSESTAIAFKTSSSGTEAEHMRIDSSGALELTGDSGAGETFLNFTADSNLTKAQISGAKQGGSGGNLIFSTNNSSATLTESMRIDSTGAVTMPLQPSFRAYKTSTSSSGALTWNGTYHNAGSHFNISNGKFTAPIDGFYYISISFLTDSNTTQTSVHLGLNGVANDGVRLRSASSAYHETTSASHVIYLNANDYIEPAFSGGTVYGDLSYSWTLFSGHLLG